MTSLFPFDDKPWWAVDLEAIYVVESVWILTYGGDAIGRLLFDPSTTRRPVRSRSMPLMHF